PLRAPPRQPSPGPARLLRRPHLRAHRQTRRRILPHRVVRKAGLSARSTSRNSRAALIHGSRPFSSSEPPSAARHARERPAAVAPACSKKLGGAEAPPSPNLRRGKAAGGAEQNAATQPTLQNR